MTYSDSFLASVLKRAQAIAVVGFSANPKRPSHAVAQYLQATGYRVVPVNPGLAGQVILGEDVYPDVRSIPHDIDMVDLFCRSEAVPAAVDQALERWANLGSIWMQLGVVHHAAAEKASRRGVQVVMNRCPKIEIPRLGLRR